jgi:clan AA aspartic protease
MMTGTVNDLREAILRLVVRGPMGEREVEAVVDTGFDGSLTLPSDLVAELGLPFTVRGIVLLGDGTRRPFDAHEGVVLWNGQPRRISVEVADTEPLLGMRLMYGSELKIEIVENGAVSLHELSAS